MNLTTLGNLKAWLAITTSADDALLQRLITQVSGLVYAYLQRSSLIQQTYTENRNGSGGCRIMMENWPVLSVQSVYINGLEIPAAPAETTNFQAGWFLSPWNGLPPGRAQTLLLRDYFFCKGQGNVALAYTAGYATLGEPQTIPSTSAYNLTPLSPYGTWAADSGVTFASSGQSLTAVASNPGTGQYVAPVYGSTTQYQFAAADAGNGVLLSYSYIPAPIEQACIELCGERYKYKSRIGQTSLNINGAETAAFSLKGIPEAVAEMLDPYVDYVQDFSV